MTRQMEIRIGLLNLAVGAGFAHVGYGWLALLFGLAAGAVLHVAFAQNGKQRKGLD